MVDHKVTALERLPIAVALAASHALSAGASVRGYVPMACGNPYISLSFVPEDVAVRDALTAVGFVFFDRESGHCYYYGNN